MDAERRSARLVDRLRARCPGRRDPDTPTSRRCRRRRARTRVVRLGLAGGARRCHAARLRARAPTRTSGASCPAGERRDRRARPLDERSAIDVRPDPPAAAGHLASSRRFGVVLFSDVAYEAIPPATPARELRKFVRFFRSGYRYDENGDSAPAVAVGAVVLGGHVDLVGAAARGAAPRAASRTTDRGVVLISDLADDPSDLQQLADTVALYSRRSIPLSVVGSRSRAGEPRVLPGAARQPGRDQQRLSCRRRRPGAARSRSQASFPGAALVAGLVVARARR